MKARRSTSGSTLMPKSAFSRTTVSLNSTRFLGRGSGLWAKSPVGSPLSVMHSTPSFSNSLGIIMPPTELMESSTTLKPALRTAPASTASRASTAAMCSSVKSCSSILPRSSTSAKSKSPFSAQSRMACPCAAVRNSPSSLRSLRAFHWRGLWDAVRIIPPSAFEKRTASSVVGVDAKPHFTTSTPHATRVPHTRFSTITPLRRASRPTTTLYLAALGALRLRNSLQYAYVNLTMSTGVRASPGAPPMVPLIPEIDLISVISTNIQKKR